MKKQFLIVCVAIACTISCFGQDKVTFINQKTIDCNVIKDTKDSITVIYNETNMSFPKSKIKDIQLSGRKDFSFDTIPNGSKQIVILTNDDEATAYIKMGRLLINNWYNPEFSDPQFRCIITKENNRRYGILGLSQLDIKLLVNIEKSDKTRIVIKAKVSNEEMYKYLLKTFGAGDMKYTFDRFSVPVVKTENSVTLIGAGFKLMNDLAIQYENARIIYE